MSSSSAMMCLVLLVCMMSCVMLTQATTQRPCFNAAPYYRHYSTKTLYEDVRDKQLPSQDTISGCQPSLFYMLARHGSRYPGDDDILDMINILPDFRDTIVKQFFNGSSHLCLEDINKLVNWNLRISLNEESKLAPVGYQEMVDVAKRFQTRFPTLLKREFKSSELLALSTYKSRTQNSAKGFLEGLFNRTDIEPDFKRKGQDKLLRFYDACQRYIDELDDAPIHEYDKFQEGSVFRQMIRGVEERLGLTTNNLTKEVVHIIYRMCVYDHVLYSDSPWCVVFSKSDLKVIEYKEDLKYLYKYGFGAPDLQHLQACDLMKDFFTHMRNSASSLYSGPGAVLRFAHSQTIQTFIASLGLFKDDILPTADNMDSQVDRKWQTSVFGPFGANIAVAVYTCQNHDQAKVKVFVNDKSIVIPGCGSMVCDLNQVFKKSRDFADKCDFDEICSNQPSASSKVNSMTIVIYLTVVLALMSNSHNQF